MKWKPKIENHPEEAFMRACAYYDVPVVSARLAFQIEARRMRIFLLLTHCGFF